MPLMFLQSRDVSQWFSNCSDLNFSLKLSKANESDPVLVLEKSTHSHFVVKLPRMCGCQSTNSTTTPTTSLTTNSNIIIIISVLAAIVALTSAAGVIPIVYFYIKRKKKSIPPIDE